MLFLLECFQLAILALVAVTISGKEKKWNSELDYDYIIIGAGTAGAVIASRLSENDKYSVLLLEAGGKPHQFNQIPYFSGGPFKGEFDWSFPSEGQKRASWAYIDHKLPLPRGKGLGGSTIINGMVFTRGNKYDFDHWEELGNDGWGYEDVLPYFIKMEDYQSPFLKPEDERYHGKGGPLTISEAPYKTQLAQVMLDAGKEMGYSHIDINAATQTGFFQNVFTLRNGSRCTMYDAYLKPHENRSNLHIVTHAFVTKIKFDNKKTAIGVIFEKDNVTYSASVKREIILSAGTNNSPHLLMLSGIGPKKMLEKFKIDVILDSPGVGLNLQDHACLTGLSYSFDEPVGFIPSSDVTPETLYLWEKEKLGPLTCASRTEAIGFLNSKYANKSMDWPDIELQPIQIPVSTWGLKPEYKHPLIPRDGRGLLVVQPILLRPKSVGFMTLKSADPHTPMIFDPNFFSVEEDVEVMLEALKAGIQFMKTTPFKKYGAKYNGRIVPGCEDFEEFSDEYLKCFIKYYSFGLYHQIGTCKMGPKSDPLAVVDSKLRVLGVSGLRVADASIFPKIISAHTMAGVVMVGEKASDLILDDWNQIREEL